MIRLGQVGGRVTQPKSKSGSLNESKQWPQRWSKNTHSLHLSNRMNSARLAWQVHIWLTGSGLWANTLSTSLHFFISPSLPSLPPFFCPFLPNIKKFYVNGLYRHSPQAAFKSSYLNKWLKFHNQSMWLRKHWFSPGVQVFAQSKALDSQGLFPERLRQGYEEEKAGLLRPVLTDTPASQGVGPTPFKFPFYIFILLPQVSFIFPIDKKGGRAIHCWL